MFKSWNDIVKNCVQGDVATIGCIPAIFINVVNALLIFSGLFSLLMFIYSGYRYIHSGGDPKKLENARNTLIYAILGLIIVLFSFGIINLISTITGVKCIKFGQFGFSCQ